MGLRQFAPVIKLEPPYPAYPSLFVKEDVAIYVRVLTIY